MVLLSLFASLTVGGGVASGSPIYSIGNSTPGTQFFIQGQSFTPSVAGNDGSGVPMAGADGTVRLLTFSFDFVNPVTAPSALHIFAFEPTLAAAGTGAGSLGTGTYLGGGVYGFGAGLALDFVTKYFAVLPFSAGIFDGSGNPYAGGVDMFPMPLAAPTNVTEGFGDFDAGFNATFEVVPEPSTLVLVTVGAGMLIGIARRRR